MLNRRTLLGAAAALPIIPLAARAQEVTTHYQVDRPGRLISLSPSGERAIFQEADKTLLMLDLATDDVLASAPPSPHTTAIYPISITWKLDSSGIAFSLPAFQLWSRGIILGLNEGDNDIHAITGDLADDMKMEIGDDAVIDIAPAYGPDGLYFVRSTSTGESQSTVLMHIPDGATEPDEVTVVSDEYIGSMFEPIRANADGSVVGWQTEPTGSLAEIVRISDSGETTKINGDGGPEDRFNLLSIGNAGTRFSVVDIAAFQFWILDAPVESTAGNATPASAPAATPQTASGWRRVGDFFGEGKEAMPGLHSQDARMALVAHDSGMIEIHDGTELRDWGMLANWGAGDQTTELFWSSETLVVSTNDRYWIIDTSRM